MELKRVVTGVLRTNAYVLTGSSGTVWVVDPAGEEVVEYIKSLENDLSRILLTHGHYDHVLGVSSLQAMDDAPVYAHRRAAEFLASPKVNLSTQFLGENCRVKVDHYLDDGDQLDLDGYKFKVLHTPGHTPGSISFVSDDYIISGDVIFAAGYIGRVDLPGGDIDELRESIHTILSLEVDKEILPGHGARFKLSSAREESYPF